MVATQEKVHDFVFGGWHSQILYVDVKVDVKLEEVEPREEAKDATTSLRTQYELLLQVLSCFEFTEATLGRVKASLLPSWVSNSLFNPIVLEQPQVIADQNRLLDY